MACLLSTVAFCRENDNVWDNGPLNVFKSNYIGLETINNRPYAHTARHLKALGSNYGIHFRHNLDVNWTTGLSMNFKSFFDKDQNSALSFLTLASESLYIVRIYHPLYLQVGPKVLYLLPSRTRNIPIEKVPNVETEIGAALSTNLTLVVNKHLLINGRVDRWRGTKTNRYHGFEAALGIESALP